MSFPVPDPDVQPDDDPVDLDTADLLSSREFQTFRRRDPNWFLGHVGDTIRDYCGWHIYPLKQDTISDATIGNQGIVMVPTLNLKSVLAVWVNGYPLSRIQWTPHDSGWIQLHHAWQRRRRVNPEVRIDFVHGFEKLPRTVELVGFELTARTLQQPAGVVNDMQRGYVRYKFDEFGPVLSDNQKMRLAPYTLEMD